MFAMQRTQKWVAAAESGAQMGARKTRGGFFVCLCVKTAFNRAWGLTMAYGCPIQAQRKQKWGTFIAGSPR